MKKFLLMALIAISAAACTRIETGEVGLRVGFDKTIAPSELTEGSFNQTVVGDVIKFPIREISLEVANLHPPALGNIPMDDFDVTVVYSVNPTSVSDLYTKKSRGFHAMNSENETLLMYTYLQTTVRNAVYKASQTYDAMAMNNHRVDLERVIGDTVRDTLAKENLGGAIIVGQVQIKSIEPPQSVKNSAIRLIAAKAENAAKDIEVDTASKEAKRVKELSANPDAINYMDAQSRMNFSIAAREGHINTIVIPADFKGMLNVGK